jgi:site-specific DNA-methyltransferase (adenine-specific)
MYWWLADNKRGLVNRLAWIEAGWHHSQMLIWVKESMVFSPGSDFHRLHEPCMFGWKKGKKHFSNRKLASYKDVFSLEREAFDEMPDIWYERRDKTADYVHPTQKPVRLAERALKKSSVTGDVVLEAFGGSGSTLIACEQMGRPCYVMELDPKFCDVIVDRWEKWTGKKAERIAA